MSLIGALMRGMVARADGFMSSITGINDRTRDKNTTFTAFADAPFDVDTLAAIYNGGDIAEKIARSLPEKALKQGFGLSSKGGLDPEEMQEQAKELLEAAEVIGLRDKCYEADVWGRAYGLGGILLGCSGSGAPDEPLDDEAVTSLDWLLVVDRREIIPASYYTDPASKKFGEVEYYRINPVTAQGLPRTRRGAMSSTFAATENQDPKSIALLGLLVHETRLVRFPGVLTARRDRQTNEGCDHSVYQRLFKTLQQTENNWDSVCQLMSDMSQGVFTIDGLIKLIAGGNEQALLARMQALDIGRSTARAIVLDADREKFERVTTPMGGVDEVILRTWQRLASAAEMPLTVLFGVSPAGLNATGESDIRLWYDNVQAHREQVLAPRLVRILRLLSKTLGHTAPDSWDVNWPSLWQMTPSEQADVRLKTTQADDIETKNGTILPEEIALGRYANGDEYNFGKLQIDVEARKAALKQALEDIVNPPPPPPAPPPGQRALPPGAKPPGAPPAQETSPGDQ